MSPVILPEPTLAVPKGAWPRHGHVGADEWLLSFRAPARVWSTNERGHWTKHADLKAKWRAGTAEAARGISAKPGRWYVQLSLPFRRQGTRRDPHNFTGTVVKSVIDGLTDAGLWVDDTPEYVVVGDSIFRVCPTGEFPHLVVGVHGMRLEQRT